MYALHYQTYMHDSTSNGYVNVSAFQEGNCDFLDAGCHFFHEAL